MIADRLQSIQDALAAAELDGWLFACFQGNDPISLSFLGLDREGLLVTRRCYYLVPRQGPPKKLLHALEPAMLDHLPGEAARYLTWREHRRELFRLLAGCRRLAVQYSPGNQLPSVSRLDAGTADLLRAAGCELCSSADLVQRFAAVWSDEQLQSHRRAARHLNEIVRGAFRHVGEQLRAGQEGDEYRVQQRILEQFEARGLWTESAPIVAVNDHSADPHYQPSAGASAPIRAGDFLLIDLWAKEKQPGSIYADITWCGVCAAAPSDRQQEIFGIVAAARDAGYEQVASRYPEQPVYGYEVDDACRGVIVEAGYGERFIHRTGHSIDTSDHGQGANMDNLETHDVRRLLPMTGFSIEPGIYLPGDFGVRSEINVALTPEAAEITGGEPQRELLRLLA
ncbi:MAG: aminopeptidase P family protein [Acidobacteria bacterium]|nr:MAG: aminopeptidase P family protein [Acidobacteriota bacterium]